MNTGLADALQLLQFHGDKLRELTAQVDASLAALDHALTTRFEDEIFIHITNGPHYTELAPHVATHVINAFGLHAFPCAGRMRLTMALRIETWDTIKLIDSDRTEDVLSWYWYPMVDLPGEDSSGKVLVRARLWVANHAEELLTNLCDEAMGMTRMAEAAAARIAGVSVANAPPKNAHALKSDHANFTFKSALDDEENPSPDAADGPGWIRVKST